MKIYIPRKSVSESEYIVRHVFERSFEDLSFTIEVTDFDHISIIHDNKVLTLNASFFCSVNDMWCMEGTLPDSCNYIDLSSISASYYKLPVIFGELKVKISKDRIDCDFDIFGTIFFFLTRYEEAVSTVGLDGHGRYSASESIAYKLGFLERPIADEYIGLLTSFMLKLWPTLTLKKVQNQTFVTCDVDWPFDPNSQSFKATLRSSFGDIVKRKNVFLAINRWIHLISNKLNVPYSDRARSKVSWIMDVNEEVGNKVAFYFITECTDKKYDSAFDFDSSKIRKLLNEIHSRGHEIGLHPGYNCFTRPDLFKKSANTLKRVLEEEGIYQPVLGGRMHYLRWDAKTTPKLWDDNGFDYDSTLSFADKSGFRCGTCHPFPMYDLLNRKPLKVIQRPLINMESTIIAPRYEGLGYSKLTLERFNYFKNIVKDNNGEYVLLWHNTHFENELDESIYSNIID